jgi:hypothetical protein
MRRISLTVAWLLLLAAIVPAASSANAIPGATYKGTSAQGGTVDLTVSQSGQYVSSYHIFGVYGTYTNGTGCAFDAAGAYGSMPGGSLSGNSFSFSLAGTVFGGAFAGAQSVSGTFRLYQPATPQTPACDSGTIGWTATTTASPSGNGNGNGNGKQPAAGTSAFATRLTLHRVSGFRLAGRVDSSSATCRRGRRVVVWIGHKRVRAVRSKGSGSFSFVLGRSKHRRRVHVSVAASTVSRVICRAGASHSVRT